MPESRHPILFADLGPARELGSHVRLAQQAEQAGFDAVLVDDLALEPVAVLAALVPATTRIGLICGTTTSYNEPYNIARRLLSVDHMSEGRVGWLLQPSGAADENRHYGYELTADRVARAAEFYDVVAGLWDSWEDDALLRDKASGDYMNRDKVHFLEHVGPHFRVRGPLNITRSSQGWPVVAMAPTNDAERALAARAADVIFTTPASLAEAHATYADLKARATTRGRMPLVMAKPPAGIDLATWFEQGAVDGFLLSPSDPRASTLQRHSATGNTLRERLGLPVPVNRYAVQRGATPARG